MRIAGDTELGSRIRPSSAVSRWLDYGPTSRVIWRAIMLWAWLRSSCFFGESLPEDVGGREWIWIALRAWKGN